MAAGFAGCADGATDLPYVPRLETAEDALVALPAPELLHRVRDLQVDEEGHVWILSVDSPFVSVIREDGRPTTSFGTPGPGPAELGTPWSLIPIGTGGVLVWDAGRRRVLEYALSDDSTYFVSGVPVEIQSNTVIRSIEETSYGTPLRMAAAGKTFVVQPAQHPVLNSGDLRKIVLLMGPAPAAVQDTLYTGPPSADSSAAEFLVPVPLWTACEDGSVVVLEPPARLMTLDPASGTADTVLLPVKAADLKETDLRRYLRHSMEVELTGRARPPEEVIQRRIDQVVRDGRDLFGHTAPAATSLLCDEIANLWIQAFSTSTHPVGFGDEWLVVHGGRVIAEVRFPVGFQPRAIRRSGVYGVRRDELDVEHPYFLPTNARWTSILYPPDASLDGGSS
jgi:hypothetical protein